MRVLVVTLNVPRPTWGAGTRNWHLLRALSGVHTVSLVALVNDPILAAEEVRQLDVPLRTVHLLPLPRAQKRWRQASALLRGQSYLLSTHSSDEARSQIARTVATDGSDLVLFEGALVADHTLPLGVRVVLDEHNVEFDLLARSAQHERSLARRWFNSAEHKLLKPREIAICERADLVSVTSPRDAAVLRRAVPEGNIHTIPNGVDTVAFMPREDADVPGRIVFAGTLAYAPNVQAVLLFAERCWPAIHARMPAATWHIVGSAPPPEVQRLERLPGITVTGFVPDMRTELAAAAVCVVPLRIGGGTRLKILEALAMGKAVVSTSDGAEGLDILSGEHLQIADDAEAFTEATLTLLGDPARRVALGRAGRALVERRYTWTQSGEALLTALDALPGMSSLTSLTSLSNLSSVVECEVEQP